MGKTVLVVDDDAGLRDTLETLLESEGYTVVLATDGLDALRQLEGFRPAVILLDMMMPRMNGVEFAHALDQRDMRAGLPIIVLTAEGRPQQRAREIRAEIGLAKPFDIVELLDVVARYAGSAAGTSAGQTDHSPERHP